MYDQLWSWFETDVRGEEIHEGRWFNCTVITRKERMKTYEKEEHDNNPTLQKSSKKRTMKESCDSELT